MRYTRPDLERPFKLPLVFPVVFLLLQVRNSKYSAKHTVNVHYFPHFQIAFLIFPFFTKPLAPAICFAFIVSGLPIYFLLVWPDNPPDLALRVGQAITRLLQKLTVSLPEGAAELEEKQEEVEGTQANGRDNPAFDKDK